MPSMIRLATEDDAEGIQSIYAPIVEHTPISFEYEIPSVAEMRTRVQHKIGHFPWLVLDQDGEILGYVYAGSHSERAAYQWSVDVSVYIKSTVRRSGIGRALYTSLFNLLRRQGFYNAYAGVSLPNDGSVGLHTALGFQPVGVYPHVGYKFGKWHDVGWWYLILQELVSEPIPPKTLAAIQQLPEWDRLLASGLALLKSS
ncbi:MAG: arsinothricin resistance N-acetyltransferase ArsN1 family B [Chloroflexota bacterium]